MSVRQPLNIATVGGLAVAGAFLSGVGALFLAFGSRSANPLAAAVALLAAAVAFCGIAYVIFGR
jgi:drug/metabolite transporter (DMT)-like permease